MKEQAYLDLLPYDYPHRNARFLYTLEGFLSGVLDCWVTQTPQYYNVTYFCQKAQRSKSQLTVL